METTIEPLVQMIASGVFERHPGLRAGLVESGIGFVPWSPLGQGFLAGKLEPGMMLTVEPGMYIRPDKTVPREFWNIGIRIEDDVLVTATGRRVITEAAPKSVAAIEETMRAGEGG